MSDSFDWYKKIYNTKETKKLDDLNRAINSIKGFLKKREEGDYEIEEKEGVVQTHEKSGLSEGMAGMEGTLEEIIEELLTKDLTPEARAKVEMLKALLLEYNHAEDVFDTQKEINQVKQKLADQIQGVTEDLNELANEHTLYNITLNKEGELGITLDDIFPEAGATPKKKRKKKNEFDIEAPTDDGSGEWEAVPKKARKKKATVKAKQKARATKAKATVKAKKATKAKSVKETKRKEPKAVKGVKVKVVRTPKTKSTKPTPKTPSARDLQQAEQIMKEREQLAKDIEKMQKELKKKDRMLRKLGFIK